MCTAYEIDGASYDVDFLVADAFEASIYQEGYHLIRLTDRAPVLMPDGKLRIMSWAFKHVPWGQKKSRPVGNTREDHLHYRLWSESLRERRCLVPMTGFFEWHENPDKSKTPFLFTRPTREMLWVAGLWREEEGRGEVFSMITTEPTPSIAPVHDRLLKVLTAGERQAYLTGEMDAFGPSTVALEWRETENFLKGRTRAKEAIVPPPPGPRDPEPPKPAQGELF